MNKTDPEGLFAEVKYHVKSQKLEVTAVDLRGKTKKLSFPTGDEYKVWSGTAIYANKPEYANKKELGPIPKGDYDILPFKYRTTDHNRQVGHPYQVPGFPLQARKGTETFNRSGFTIEPALGSAGCIVIESRVNPKDPKYPSSPEFDQLRDALSNTPKVNGKVGILHVTND